MDRKTVFHIAQWLIALVGCGYLGWRLVTYDDYASLVLSLRSMGVAQWSALVLCVLLMPVNMCIEAWRWRTLWGEEMSVYEANRQVYYSKLAGLITPWRLGEYPARGLLMVEDSASKEEGERLMAKVLSMGGVGSATMTMAIVIAGVVALPAVRINALGDSYLWCVGTVILLLATALVFAPRLLKRWAEVSHRTIAISLGQSFIRLLCWCVQLWLVLYALSVFDISIFRYFDVSMLFVYYLLVTVTPNVPIVEVGVRGAWAMLLFGSANAALAGVLLWAINTVLPCLIWPFFRKNKK